MRTWKKANKTLLQFLCFLLTAVIFFILQNNALVISKYTYTSPKLPAAFDNYTIVQISDLHNKDFRGKLVAEIKQLKPDMIVITGDLIDRRKTKIETAVAFIREVVKIAPTYYVSGNHEQLSDDYDVLLSKLQALQVHMMEDAYEPLEKNGAKIGIIGLADPANQEREESYLWVDSSGYVKAKLQELCAGLETDFNILLSHRPELFSVYREMQLDLVFSGHAHGGQIRLPFIGGLIAPNQGFFPQFTQGVHTDHTTAMVVSRGLGNSVFPLRVFNRPELVVVTLKQA
ncbi:MAG: metallophosphoesterase [Dethiobacteraceae bacterium]|jgi:predicted MPP superfamily phosphohydrolase|nr:metallophosphoesterase [Bacillota bacterium]